MFLYIDFLDDECVFVRLTESKLVLEYIFFTKYTSFYQRRYYLTGYYGEIQNYPEVEKTNLHVFEKIVMITS
jgi:hypothetical protein